MMGTLLFLSAFFGAYGGAIGYLIGVDVLYGVISGGVIFPVVLLVSVVSHIVRSVLDGDAYSIVRQGTVRTAGALLPTHTRQEYMEEWQAWLLDMRADGVPWRRLLVEILSLIFVAAPCLAVRLRRQRQRVGE